MYTVTLPHLLARSVRSSGKDHLSHKKNIDVPSVDGESTLPLAVLIQKSLEAVMAHTLNSINQRHTLTDKDPVFSDDIFWVLCVPAVWDGLSCEMMRSCAKNAGMTHLELGLEPIASTFHVLNSRGQDFVKWNEQFMVLDCGGRNTDAACFKILSQNSDLAELHLVDGIRAGALDVDEKFQALLAALFPKEIVGMRCTFALVSFCRVS